MRPEAPDALLYLSQRTRLALRLPGHRVRAVALPADGLDGDPCDVLGGAHAAEPRVYGRCTRSQERFQVRVRLRRVVFQEGVEPGQRPVDGRPAAGVFDLLAGVFEDFEPIDVVTVAEALERHEELEAVGGRAYLSSLSNETPTAVHAAQYARIVERKAVLRGLIGAAGRIAGIGYEDPAEIQEAIDRAEAELFAWAQQFAAAALAPTQDGVPSGPPPGLRVASITRCFGIPPCASP